MIVDELPSSVLITNYTVGIFVENGTDERGLNINDFTETGENTYQIITDYGWSCNHAIAFHILLQSSVNHQKNNFYVNSNNSSESAGETDEDNPDNELDVTVSGPEVVCPNKTYTYTCNASGGKKPYTFKWNNEANTTGSEAEYQMPDAGTKTVTCDVEDSSEPPATGSDSLVATVFRVSSITENTRCIEENSGRIVILSAEASPYWPSCGNAEWKRNNTYIGTGRSMAFSSSISPGKYKFKARAEDSEHGWVESSEITVVDSNWSPHSLSIKLSAPPTIVNKIEGVINRIPNITVSLDEATASATAQSKDCCAGSSVREDGERYKEGSMTLSAKIKGTIWGPPTISKTFDWGFLVVDIDFEAGVGVDSNYSVSGTAGQRWDECKTENCYYGSVSAGASITTKISFEVIACVETYYTDKKCIDINATPAAVTIGIAGSLDYNSKDSCSIGLHGDVQLLSIVFNAQFTVAGSGLKYEYQIYP